jgi:hypothetical protein
VLTFTSVSGLLYKGFPYPSVLVTATSAQYRYYQDDSKEGVVVKFNSVSPGSQLAQASSQTAPSPSASLVP